MLKPSTDVTILTWPANEMKWLTDASPTICLCGRSVAVLWVAASSGTLAFRKEQWLSQNTRCLESWGMAMWIMMRSVAQNSPPTETWQSGKSQAAQDFLFLWRLRTKGLRHLLLEEEQPEQFGVSGVMQANAAEAQWSSRAFGRIRNWICRCTWKALAPGLEKWQVFVCRLTMQLTHSSWHVQFSLQIWFEDCWPWNLRMYSCFFVECQDGSFFKRCGINLIRPWAVCT